MKEQRRKDPPKVPIPQGRGVAHAPSSDRQGRKAQARQSREQPEKGEHEKGCAPAPIPLGLREHLGHREPLSQDGLHLPLRGCRKGRGHHDTPTMLILANAVGDALRFQGQPDQLELIGAAALGHADPRSFEGLRPAFLPGTGAPVPPCGGAAMGMVIHHWRRTPSSLKGPTSSPVTQPP